MTASIPELLRATIDERFAGNLSWCAETLGVPVQYVSRWVHDALARLVWSGDDGAILACIALLAFIDRAFAVSASTHSRWCSIRVRDRSRSAVRRRSRAMRRSDLHSVLRRAHVCVTSRESGWSRARCLRVVRVQRRGVAACECLYS